MENSLVTADKIQEYIPQKFPIVMIDELLYCDDTVTKTRLRITEENIFTHNGFFLEPGIIENIAQTIAVRVGYYYKEILKKEPPTGFIGAIRKLEIIDLPKLNTVIETEVKVVQEIFGVTMVNGEVYSDGNLIASCEMKTVLQEL